MYFTSISRYQLRKVTQINSENGSAFLDEYTLKKCDTAASAADAARVNRPHRAAVFLRLSELKDGNRPPNTAANG